MAGNSLDLGSHDAPMIPSAGLATGLAGVSGTSRNPARVLLVNPRYYKDIFAQSTVRAAISPGTVPLGLLTVAAPLIAAGHEVKLVDLNLLDEPEESLHVQLAEFAPRYVGITATTPLITKAYLLASVVKERRPGTLVVVGGPHASAMPEEVLRESDIDCVITGEGDLTFARIIDEGLSPDIPNLLYKKNAHTCAFEAKGASRSFRSLTVLGQAGAETPARVEPALMVNARYRPESQALVEQAKGTGLLDRVVSDDFQRVMARRLSPEGPARQPEEIVRSQVQNAGVRELDELPFPAYELIDVRRYEQPFISSRAKPLGYLETSRGCYARCVFCDKGIHGYKLRTKSPTRVVDEMEHMLAAGFREIHIIDDIFTADQRRAMAVCEEMMRRGLKFPWYPRGGTRVDNVSWELFDVMRRAGCYRIAFGVESGSERMLSLSGKGITKDQAREAVAIAKKSGMETECYFMLGLPTETEADIEESIRFAVELNPDYVKFAIAVPLPGTPMFDTMMRSGQIKTRDWTKYTFSTPPAELYDHDVLDSATIVRYATKGLRRFYFRPSYLAGMVLRTIRNGTFVAHARAAISTRWFG